MVSPEASTKTTEPRSSNAYRKNVPTPDYKLAAPPEPVFVEVKEFGRSGKLGTGGYCLVPFVREKIKARRKKFERHLAHPWCVVLHNEASFTVVLQPELVLCAIFGELYETVDQNVFRYLDVGETARVCRSAKP